MENTIDLNGNTVLVTGGSQGIGAEICRKMASCGAHVLVNYHRSKEKAELLVEELRREYGVNSFAYKADVSNHDEIHSMFQFMDEYIGPIGILINNAGCESIDYAVEMDIKEWDRIMNVNLRGSFICAQEAGKRMTREKNGVIINISSIHDKVPRKGLIHYCCSKAGLKMMTKCLALELAEFNIRVLTVSPGAIETEMNKEEISRFGREKFNGWIPLGRIGSTEDIAWTCAFLASKKSGYCTASEIYIDGGYMESTIPYDPRKPRKNTSNHE